MAKKTSGLFNALQTPESAPKNPMGNPGMMAMQQRLAGAKQMKPMKPPMPRKPKMKMGGSKVG